LQLAAAWLASPKRREYQGIIFEPQIKNDKFYNLFKGFDHEPIQGDWSLFKKHIFENICCKNMINFEWLLAWMSRMVQDPGGKKPGTSVVLRGERGTGKSIFVEIFGKVFGHHFFPITNSKQVTGRFNAHLKDCILLYMDEAWFAGDRSSEGVLKGLITSDKHMIELKGKDAFVVSNHVNCIISSNSSWVIPVGNKERRFFVLDVGNDHIQDHPYFEKIDQQMNEEGGIEAMLHDLMAIDISKFNLREAPKTSGLSDQLIQNFSSFDQFWFEKLISNAEIGEYDMESNSENMILKSKLYDEYVDFCKKINLKYIFTQAVFGRNLSKSCDFEVTQRLQSNGKYARSYIFPEKNVCRKQFTQQIGMEIDWDSSRVKKIKNDIDEI
jgi:phage/plasmid-associated DNA primase